MKESENKRKVKTGELLIEGKTKKVFENTLDASTVIIEFKPDITAGDGEKHEIIVGKDKIDCITNDNFFRLLNAWKISTHYIRKLNKTEFLAKRLVRKAPFEVVTRRIATGSYLDRNDVEEGNYFKELCTEFFYKDDFFNDPMIDPTFIKAKDKKGYFAEMWKINDQAFLVAEEVLCQLGYQLIDWKQEYGWPVGSAIPLIAGDLVMIDEITAGNTRIWPIKVKKLDLSKNNLIDQLDRKGSIDKQHFREGGDLKTVKTAFEVLAEVTKKFSQFHPR